jgi:hypothetical protein
MVLKYNSETILPAKWFRKQQLSINSLKPFYQQNDFGVQLIEIILPAKWFMKQQLNINSLKPFYQQNSFRVQLSETILPGKWFRYDF